VWEEAKLDKYQSLLKQQKASRLPTVSLYYQYYQNWATDDFMGFSGAQKLPQQVFGVKLTMSGLLSATTTQKINQYEWQLELQQQQLESTKLVKQKEDESLQLEFRQAFGQLAENKQILILHEQNDVHAENKYQAGIMSLDTRLDKYDDLLEAQDHYLQSLAEYTLAQYKIYIRQIDFQPKK
jgi:outer membrane protein TolC